MVPGAGLEPARCYQRGILNQCTIFNKINDIMHFFIKQGTSESRIIPLIKSGYYEGEICTFSITTSSLNRGGMYSPARFLTRN